MTDRELSTPSGEPPSWVDVERYVEIADRALLEVLPEYAVLWPSDRLTKAEWRTIYEISAACISASGSQLTLIQQRRLRDAEILARSVLEGSLRFLYILADPIKAKERLAEFTGPLFDFAQMKNHRRVENICSKLGASDERMLRPLRGLLLSEQEVQQIQSKYSKRDRNMMEERWSVTAIIAELIELKIPGHEYLPPILQSYARSSHVAHVDYFGIIAMQERYDRSPERLAALDAAHAASLMENILMFMFVRLGTALHFVGAENKRTLEVGQRMLTVVKEIGRLSESWYALEFSNA